MGRNPPTLRFGGVAPRRAKVERGIGFFWILHWHFIPPRRSLLRGAAVNASPLTAYALLIGFFYRFFASQLTKWPLTTLQTEFLSISGYLSRFDAVQNCRAPVRKCRAKCANCRGSSRKCRVSCQNCRALNTDRAAPVVHTCDCQCPDAPPMDGRTILAASAKCPRSVLVESQSPRE